MSALTRSITSASAWDPALTVTFPTIDTAAGFGSGLGDPIA
jgi:hypothetical protein